MYYIYTAIFILILNAQQILNINYKQSWETNMSMIYYQEYGINSMYINHTVSDNIIANFFLLLFFSFFLFNFKINPTIYYYSLYSYILDRNAHQKSCIKKVNGFVRYFFFNNIYLQLNIIGNAYYIFNNIILYLYRIIGIIFNKKFEKKS